MADRRSDPARVLVVMADAEAAVPAVAALLRAGHDARWEVDSLSALVATEDWLPALIVLDWGMPFISGEIFLSSLEVGLDAAPPVVALVAPGTAGPSPARIATLLPAPPDPAELAAVVGRLLAHARPDSG